MPTKYRTIDDRLAGTKLYYYLHPMAYLVYHEILRVTGEYARGKTLDIGAGLLTNKRLIEENGSEIIYTSTDIEKRHEDIDVVADFCGRTDFADGEFDTVFCSQVLEHVKEPSAFMAEAFRVTARGGRFIALAPFLYFVHGHPHDYRRYTPEGLARLAEAAGFSVIEKKGVGGLLSFVSLLFYMPVFHVLRFLPPWLLLPLFVSVVPIAWLDRIIDTTGRFPAIAAVVAEKKTEA